VHLLTLFSRPSQRPFKKLALDTNGSFGTRAKRIKEMALEITKLWKKEQGMESPAEPRWPAS
jgi:hypothetical protein